MIDTSKNSSTDLTADIAALRKDIVHLTDTVTRLVAHQVDGATEQVKSSANAYMKAGAEQFKDAKGQFDAAATDIEKKIEHNPLTAMAIAAGLGLLIGVTVNAKR